MSDPREWVFADWFRFFLRVLPAFLAALVVVLIPIFIAVTLFWWLLSVPAR